MDFTVAYWASEVAVFRESFADLDTSDDSLELLVRGACFVAAHTSKEHPEAWTEIMALFKECMDIAHARMGDGWFIQHAVVISTHSDPEH
jgi:hypothetical protein